MTDTPETDHIENNMGNAAHPILLSFCRKLERERAKLVAELIKEREILDNADKHSKMYP